MAQLLVSEGIKNFPPAGRFAFSTVAQTARRAMETAFQPQMDTDEWG
jgi:hypothetical protein